MTIKLIALDLDGTTLNSQGKLGERNRNALKEAFDMGVNIVIATGRPFCALPGEIKDFEPVRYVLTSNGARITDLHTGEAIYENCLDGHAVEAAVAMLREHNYVLETFVNGTAYIEGDYYREVERTGKSFRDVNYILSTRHPVDNFYEFMLRNKNGIENINVNFSDISEKPAMKKKLETLPDVTITSSFDHNLEIGGASTSKAEALRRMCEIMHVEPSQMLAAGDSPNDMAMLSLAGFPVAVANAKPEVKEIAKFIAPSNDDDGVAVAVKKFVLK